MSEAQKNVLGEDLEECSKNPLTGWFRDGCCNTDEKEVKRLGDKVVSKKTKRKK